MKKILIFILLVVINLSAFCQEQLSGIYKLNYPELHESNPMYLNFTKNNFIYFSLGSSIELIDGIDELKEIGTGKYNLSKNKIILNFKTDSFFILPYIYDSILVSYSSKKNQNSINISVEFNSLITTHSKASLIIETSLKEYVEIINCGIQKVVSLPAGTIIKSIKIAALEMPLKYLPFDLNFNNVKYVFFAKDNKSAIRAISNQILQLEIKKRIGASQFNFEFNNFLKKIDKKELEFLKSLSLEKEPRLNKILNY